MLIKRIAFSRFLNSSWIGMFSLLCTRELASPTKMARPQPPKKYAHGPPKLPDRMGSQLPPAERVPERQITEDAERYVEK